MLKKIIFVLLITTTHASWADCISPKTETIGDALKTLHCFQKEINELKNEVNELKKFKSVSNGERKIIVNTFPKIKKPTISKTTNVENFQIDLLQCKRNLTKVTCNFVITNLGKDGYFYIYEYDEEFYDEYGDNYQVSSINMNNGSKSRKFITNIPIKNIKVTINNVPENVTQFVRFKLKALNSNYIKFNNVLILK